MRTIWRFKPRSRLIKKWSSNNKELWLSSRIGVRIWNCWKPKKRPRLTSSSNRKIREENLCSVASQRVFSAFKHAGSGFWNSKHSTRFRFTPSTYSLPNRSLSRFPISLPKQSFSEIGLFWLEKYELIVKQPCISKNNSNINLCVTKRTVLEISNWLYKWWGHLDTLRSYKQRSEL